MPDKRPVDKAVGAWRPDPRNTPAGKAKRWAFPQLTLRIWAEVDGMNLLAYVQTVDNAGKLHTEEIGRAVWQPHAVTERMVVDWGRRCLEAWLASHPAVS